MFRGSFILCTFSRTVVVGVPLGPATYPDMGFFVQLVVPDLSYVLQNSFKSNQKVVGNSLNIHATNA